MFLSAFHQIDARNLKYRARLGLSILKSSPRAVLATAVASVIALVAAAPGPASAAPRVPGELILKYRLGTSGAEREKVRRAAGVRPSGTVDGRTQAVRVLRGQTTDKAARKLEADPRVVHALPNYRASATALIPNDPGREGAGGWANLQWNFAGPFGVGAPDAWQNAINAGAPGGSGVIVALLDTGVAYRDSKGGRFKKAPDLARRRFVSGHDFVRRDDYPFDRNGHGTFVAGLIAQSTNNHLGVTGLAYKTRIMPVRVLDYEGKGDVATIARGIRYATRHHAKVINMSFEFDIGLSASQIPDVIAALRHANRSGAVLVAAAGNTEDTQVAYPARAKHAIAVGATTEHGCLAEYSNTGSGLDVVAPGGGADAAIDGDPNCRPLEDPGRDVYQYTFRGASPRRFGLPGGYEGTSMAVPHVSATAALIVGERLLGPDPTPEAITARLETTARDLGKPGYDSMYGYGLLNAAAATAPLP
jgi:serine protease